MTLDEYFAEATAKTPIVLADEVGVSESTLSRIRRGIQNTTRDVIIKIVAATGGLVSADEIIFPHGRPLTDICPKVAPTKLDEDIRNGSTLADNFGENIRDGSQALERQGEADSHGPFSGSPPTSSPILTGPTGSCTSPASSTGAAEAA